CMLGHDQPLPGLPKVEAPPAPNGNVDRRGMSPDKRVHLIPEAQLVVHLAGQDDELVLQHYDVYDAVARAGHDYMIVTSQPPPSVRKGQTFTYPVTVRSSKVGIRFFLKSGPQGMAISETGTVTWTVPADFDDGEIEVQLSAADAGGQKVAQAFSVRVHDR